MGCGSSGSQRASAPAERTEGESETVNEEDYLRELTGKRIVYDKKTHEAKEVEAGVRGEERKEDDGLFQEECAGKGDQFGAVLPFIGALVEPGKHPALDKTEPTESYDLEYVYGYRSFDTRQNLYYNNAGKIVYNAAALGIILDPTANTQKFFGAGDVKSKAEHHDDDITCLSISPDRKYAATGQAGGKLFIWNAEDGTMKTTKSKYKAAKGARGISCCCWSSDGASVAFADKSDKRNVYVVTADTGALTFTGTGNSNEVFDIAWNKTPGSTTFASCGVKHIRFWDTKDSDKAGKMGTGTGGETFSCLTFDDDGNCYAGSLKGDVYTFKLDNGAWKTNEKLTKSGVHKGLIHTMYWSNKKLITGGSDRTIVVDVFGSANRISLSSVPRAIDSVKEGEYLVGLKDGTICTVKSGAIDKTYMKSHHDGEVWGLEVINDKMIMTSGDDNKVMIWDPKTRTNKSVITINEKAGPKVKYGASSITSYPDNQCSRAVAYNPSTKQVAIANNSGEVQIRNFDDSKILVGPVIKTLNPAERWIECMAYSPDGKLLAVGTHNSTILVYDTESYSKKGKFDKDNSSILSLDWSKDSQYLRTNSESYELLFYNVETMSHDPSGATNTKDMEWATQSTKIGWSVLGVFPSGTDGSHVNGVAMSATGTLIATGDDWGLVNIYRNPCREGSVAKSFRGHSEHVVRVKFGLADTYIFSIGGQDKTLMQWKKK